MARRTLLFSLLILTMLPLFGCAVMKIDVDVYRGPLANHVDVQTEQMAVMAIGVKPLLEQLEQRLEIIEGSQEHAKSVKAVLSLYTNRLPRDIIDFNNDISSALARYSTAWDAFNDKSFSDVCPLMDKEMRKDRSGNLELLYKGYKDYFNMGEGIWTWKNDIPEAHRKLYEEMKDNKDKAISSFEWSTTYSHFRNSKNEEQIASEDANTGFEALKRKNVVSSHAEFLFAKGSEVLRDKFISKVNSRAGAFLDARAVSMELLQTTLKMLAKKDSIGHPVLEEYKEAREAAVKLATSLINPTHLKVAFATIDETIKGAEGEAKKEADSIATLRKRFIDGSSSPDYLTIDDDNFKVTLLDLLTKDPSGTAALLFDAGSYMKTCKFENVTQDTWEKIAKIEDPFLKEMRVYQAGSRRRYGLTIGPNPKTEAELKNINNLNARVNDIHEGFLGAFGRGRLDEGLETMVDEYLQRTDKNWKAQDGNCQELNECLKNNLPERERLLDALVGFAEKVLLLANYRELLESPRQNWLLRQIPTRHARKQEKTREDIKKYTIVLQAVGNSILSQADELRQHKEYRKGLEKRWATEVAALKNTFSRDANTVLRIMEEQMRAERDSSAKLDTNALEDLNKDNLPAAFDALKDDVSKAKSDLENLKKAISDDNFGYVKKSFESLKEKISEIKESAGYTPEVPKLEIAGNKLATFLDDNKKSFDINTSIIKVEAYSKDWGVNKGNTSVNAVALKDELIAKISDDIAIRDNGDLRTTLKILSQRKFDIASIGDIEGTDRDPRQVLDQLISTLRYQYVQEVQAHGPDADTAKHIASAIRAASFQRSGMVYLRPSGAYLRNSYPSTSLQPSPGIRWFNMVDAHGQRGIPFLGKWMVNPDEIDLIESIDKQFWQNINSVRLAGGGNTNYVVAKDDIGNWYVKAYAANPEPIIESAKNLALFSLGPKLNANLLGRVKAQEKKVEKAAAVQNNSTGQNDSTGGSTPASEENNKPEPAPFEKLLDKYEAKYSKETESDKGEVETLLKDDGSAIKGLITNAWEVNDDIKNTASFLTDLDGKLSKTATEILNPAYKEITNKQVEKSDGFKILTAVNDIKRFHYVLIQRVRDMHVTDAPRIAHENADKALKEKQVELDNYDETGKNATTIESDKTAIKKEIKKRKEAEEETRAPLKQAENAEKAAVREATRVVRDILNKYVVKRKEAIAQYKTAIMFMGDATSAEK